MEPNFVPGLSEALGTDKIQAPFGEPVVFGEGNSRNVRTRQRVIVIEMGHSVVMTGDIYSLAFFV